MEQKDIAQDLYVLYYEMLEKDKRAKTAKPGYFFKRFKWFLMTKYRREINRKNKEWEYILKDDPKRSEKQSRIGYLSNFREPELE